MDKGGMFPRKGSSSKSWQREGQQVLCATEGDSSVPARWSAWLRAFRRTHPFQSYLNSSDSCRAPSKLASASLQTDAPVSLPSSGWFSLGDATSRGWV